MTPADRTTGSTSSSSRAPRRPVLRNLDLSNDWLYAWGDLPTNLPDLRTWLAAHSVDVQTFKDSARYEANYDRFTWLKDL